METVIIPTPFSVQTPFVVSKRKLIIVVPNIMSLDFMKIQKIEIPRRCQQVTLKILLNINIIKSI